MELNINHYQEVLHLSIRIRFLPDDVTVNAEAGDALLQVAQRAGVIIPTGCLMGSCHACEVEIENGPTLCACISAVPAGKDELTINLYSDPNW
ncbi:MAG: 2Fe-2S iron-sulfur cluster binding domain-containing protein [Coleofasciculaceae cyanobacterium]